MAWIRDHLKALEPYVPGEQPADRQVIKLNTNESPFAAAPAVLEAISRVDAEALRRYPPASATAFRQTAARVHQLQPEQIIAANGGDELLRMAITLCCDPGPAGAPGGLGLTAPTYSLYHVLAAIADTPVTVVKRDQDLLPPPADQLADQWNHARCRLAMLVNPHAPSGQAAPIEYVRTLAEQFDGLLLVDEAYVDFADADAIELVRAPNEGGCGLDNVLLLRSMSKGYALAGLRYGYGIGSEAVIHALHKVRDSYNVDILAQTAATAALDQREAYYMPLWQTVRQQRDKLADALRGRDVQVYPSQTNFLLTRFPSVEQARAMDDKLKSERIFVRYFDQDRLRNCLRISLGDAVQNARLLEVFDR